MQNCEHFDEVKKDWTRRRLIPQFRVKMTLWLYDYAKKLMSKHIRVYSSYQMDIWSEAFKRAFLTHRNAMTTSMERTSKTNDCD